MVLMDVKAALGAPMPRAFMPPRPAEYLEFQKKKVIRYLAHRIQQPIPKLEVLSFTDFITNQCRLLVKKITNLKLQIRSLGNCLSKKLSIYLCI